MDQLGEVAWLWVRQHAPRMLLLAVVLVVAVVLSKLAGHALRRTLEHTALPSATFFVNIVRATIWILAVAFVLQPVFGINPSTLLAALGISGLVLSFGLQHTIANIVGGFGLMAGKVVQPGDVVRINRVTGIVKDVTWRHTVVSERDGGELWIPNAVLDTSALEKLPAAAEAMARVPLTVKPGLNADEVAEKILSAVKTAAGDRLLKSIPPMVNYQGFSPFGMQGEVWMFVAPGVLIADVQDLATRALAGADYLAQDEPGSRNMPHQGSDLASPPQS